MENERALHGVRVVELSTYVAAPVCARMLADLGADVVKIESFKGDPWRVTAKSCTYTGDEELPVFDVYNAGKKSIRLNVKDPAGKDVLFRLLETADVFITNTRMSSLRKLGLDYAALQEKFPRLVYATVTGYGEKGPDAAAPGFDNIAFWTRSGFLLDMSVPGEGAYPVYSPTGAGDTFTGMALLGGIVSALYRREKTGRGDHVTVALQNAGLWMMASMIIQSQEKYGIKFPKERLEAAPFSTSYRCRDGEWFGITVLDHDRYRDTVFDILGIAEEMAPLQITTPSAMKQKSHAVIPIMERAFLKKSSNEWLALFQAADIVCAKLNHMKDVFQDPQAVANTFVQEYTCHNGETCMMPCPPIRLESQPVPLSGGAPLAGENTREVLQELGFAEAEIQKMTDCGAVR